MDLLFTGAIREYNSLTAAVPRQSYTGRVTPILDNRIGFEINKKIFREGYNGVLMERAANKRRREADGIQTISFCKTIKKSRYIKIPLQKFTN